MCVTATYGQPIVCSAQDEDVHVEASSTEDLQKKYRYEHTHSLITENMSCKDLSIYVHL